VSLIQTDLPNSVRIVVADANVLYSRCLRDYLLYAAEQGLIAPHWSEQILTDMTEHLIANLTRFDAAAARRLVDAMTRTFPDALVVPQPEDMARLDGFTLPDDDDRDVMATALAVEADVICTSNLKHFPSSAMAGLGLVAMSPDELFVQLLSDHLAQMIEAHHHAVQGFPGATDQSTLAALRRAQSTRTADGVAAALGLS